MNCPHCAVELKMAERRNIEIDYCPKCRGVWLDKGELDKMLASSESELDSWERGARESMRYSDEDSDKRPRKRKSFLSEIFDFD
jgi:uncharacterized protein